MQGMKTEPEQYVEAYYNVTDVTVAKTLLSSASSFNKMLIDDEEVSLRTSHTFDTLGEHIVKLRPISTTISGFNGTTVIKVILPDNITDLGWRAFQSCKSMTTITLPETIKSIGTEALQNTSITGVVNLPNVTSIGSNSFSFTKIAEVILGDLITTIPSSAFASCGSLTKVTCGKSVTSIGGSAFRLAKVATFTIYAVSPPTLTANSFEGCPLAHIYVPAESVEAYKTATYWSNKASIISAIPT